MIQAGVVRVEKDGSGDFTVIQDALDAAAAGDSVLIGKGRFEDFHLENFQSGGTGAMIMVPRTGPITIIGAGRDSTVVGPLVQQLTWGGHDTGGFATDINPPAVSVEDIGFNNTSWPIQLQGRGPVSIQGCRVSGGAQAQVALVGASCVTFESCYFEGETPYGAPRAITSFFGFVNDSLKVRDSQVKWGGGIEVHGSQGFEASNVLFEAVAVPFIFRSTRGSIQRVIAVSPGLRAIDMADSDIEASECHFGVGARTTVYLRSSGALTATRCDFGAGTDFTLDLATADLISITDSNIRHFAPTTLNALSIFQTWNFENNYWDSTDSTEIASWILDANDSSGRPIVDFVPFRTGPVTVPTAGISVGGLKALFGGGHD